MRYWAQVQSCASRVACAALVELPEDAAKLVQEAAVLCQTAVRAYSQDPGRASAFYAVYARCQLAYGQTAEGLRSLASSLKVDASSVDAWEVRRPRRPLFSLYSLFLSLSLSRRLLPLLDA